MSLLTSYEESNERTLYVTSRDVVASRDQWHMTRDIYLDTFLSIEMTKHRSYSDKESVFSIDLIEDDAQNLLVLMVNRLVHC